MKPCLARILDPGRPIAWALAAAALAAGCASPITEGEGGVTAHPERLAQYRCRDGVPIELRFYDSQRAAVLVRDGRTRELRLQGESSDSDFVYTNGQDTVRGSRNDVTLQLARMEPVRCNSQRTDR